MRTDSERLDWLEETILNAKPQTSVTISAWWVGEKLDHFGMTIGNKFEEDFMGALSLRDLIDDAIRGEERE